MQEYLELNHTTYDFLAEEYYKSLINHEASYSVVGEKICKQIFDYVIAENLFKSQKNINVLELGCGPGSILQALKEYAYVKTYAIDFSEKMACFAHRSNDRTKIIIKNILDVYDLNTTFDEHIHGKVNIIIMAAFLHLFPVSDAQIILTKLKSWLSPDGIIYLDTTKESIFRDGEIRIKQVLDNNEILHFRTHWTKDRFNAFLADNGYDIISQHEHISNGTGKIWLRTIIKPQNQIL